MTEDDIQREASRSAMKKMAMVEMMLEFAYAICEHKVGNVLDLTVASPGIVMSLYVECFHAIEASELDDADKQHTRKMLQFQVSRLLTMMLHAIDSDDPVEALRVGTETLKQAYEMGQTGPEVH